MWVEREDCVKMCKPVVKNVMNNNSICSLSHHNSINKVLCVDHSTVLVLAMDNQRNSECALWHPSVENSAMQQEACCLGLPSNSSLWLLIE